MDIKKMIKAQEEARQVRRSTANWEFIKSLPPKLRIALEYYIETGDIYNGAKLAGMGVDEFNELRIKAGIIAVD
ncbi:hypothetical protein [Sulfurisphaera tokodaii]|uniref:hypothetical protein n=1 Tax=Sulfurisphaera tokodaii TaxID=111955 RepID=UPI000AAF84AE|nr:hypothetical protein [Sulfurisphaera tokodaii]